MPIFINLLERGEFIHAAEFQYFRIPEHLWEEGLRKLKEGGVTAISTYIPWSWHEVEEALFDFSGKTKPERDLDYFLKLVKLLGFKFIARPGPYIYAEYKGFGVPNWLRKKHPEILIKRKSGERTSEIALNHPTFLFYAERWIKRILSYLMDKVEDGLKLLAVQVDNETGMPQYNVTNVLSDYNEHTVTLFRLWLKRRYTLDEFNKLTESNFKSFNEILPPNIKSNINFRFIWYDFVEEYIVNYLNYLKDITNKTLKGKFDLFLNSPYLETWPDSHVKKSRISLLGFDLYTKLSYLKVRDDLPFSASFTANYFLALNKSNFAISPELQAGWFDPISYVPPEHTFFIGATAYLFGTQYISWYIAQDCVEEDGTPWIWNAFINKDGKITERYPVLKLISELGASTSSFLYKSKLVRDNIGILSYSLNGKVFFEGAYSQDFKKAAVPVLHYMSTHGFYGLLVDNGFMPQVISLDATPKEKLRDFDALFFMSQGIIDKENCQKLVDFVKNGGKLIIFGKPIKNILFTSEDCPLTPLEVKKEKIKMPIVTLIKLGIAKIKYNARRKKIKHKMSLHTIDSYALLLELLREFPKFTYTLRFNENKFKGEVFVELLRNGDKSFVTYNGKPISNVFEIGKGKVYFIGTSLGMLYNTFYYFEKHPTLVTQRKFVSRLMSAIGVRPTVSYSPGIEVIIRKTASEDILIGIINRVQKGKQTINLTKIIPDNKFKFKVLFNLKGTPVKSLEKAIEITFLGDDFVVVLFERK
ncbi:MAG: beta-galactosidase [Candidatus Asgardarchaeia archaeon]